MALSARFQHPDPFLLMIPILLNLKRELSIIAVRRYQRVLLRTALFLQELRVSVDAVSHAVFTILAGAERCTSSSYIRMIEVLEGIVASGLVTDDCSVRAGLKLDERVGVEDGLAAANEYGSRVWMEMGFILGNGGPQLEDSGVRVVRRCWVRFHFP
jgi:hypothetical protein